MSSAINSLTTTRKLYTMSSPNETEVIVDTESGLSAVPEAQHVVGGEELNTPDFGSVVAIPAGPDGTKDTNISAVSAVSHFSAVTFADSAEGTTTTETTAGRKINRNDVRQIFHGSVRSSVIQMLLTPAKCVCFLR